MKTLTAQSRLQQLTKEPTRISIRTLIIVPFVIQIVAAVGLTGYLSFRSGQSSVNDVASQLREEITARVNQNLHSYLATPHQINQLNQEVIRSGWLQVSSQEGWVQHFGQQLQTFPTIGSINLATEQGEFIGLGRNESGSLVMNLANQANNFAYEQYALNDRLDRTSLLKSTARYDARTRPQYKAAVVAGKPTWSEVFPHITDPMLIISAVEPIYDQQRQLQGVLQTRLNLSLVSQFLGRLEVGKTGRTFIVERSGFLIASSAKELPFHRHGNQTEKITARESQDSLIQATAHYLSQQFPDLNQITREQQLSFTNWAGERQFVQISPFADAQGLNWLVVVTIPESDFMTQINQNNRRTLVLCGLALVGSILLGIFASHWITRPILQLKQAATALARGDFDQHLSINRRDELGILASAFNSMVSQLQDAFKALQQTNEDLEKRVQERTTALETAHQKITLLNEQLQEENLRMGAELDIARTLQQMILPKEQELQQIPGLDVAGFMQAANEVGGDYYDVLTSHNGLVRIGIGDVTGHGLESGVLMIMVQTAVRTLLAANEQDPVKVLNTLNQVIYENAQRMNTDKNLSLMLLDYSNGRVSLSGQHEEMIVVRHDGEVERIDTIDLGFPIGLVDDITEFVTQRQIDLQPDDVAVLYTDGITEAESPDHRLYGLEQLVSIIKQNYHSSACGIRQSIVEDVRSHIGDQIVHDDITLVVLKQK